MEKGGEKGGKGTPAQSGHEVKSLVMVSALCSLCH